MEAINNFFKKEPNLSFVTAKIQQNCTDTGNDNSEATRQRINCAVHIHQKRKWGKKGPEKGRKIP